jgi:hypothetical protein
MFTEQANGKPEICRGNQWSKSHKTSLSIQYRFRLSVDPAGKRKVVTRQLRCALKEDQDFSDEHVIERYGEGQVIKECAWSDDGRLYYTSLFFETFNKDTTRKYISGEELKRILGHREKIPCKVVMTIYLSNPYYSATMWVPSAEILKVLPQDFPMPVEN